MKDRTEADRTDPDRGDPDRGDPDRIAASGLGTSQRRVLVLLKRDGEQSVSELAATLDLADETVRAHMNALAGHGLVRRAGSRRDGPGRPEILYGLTDEAEALFPQEEGRLLRELTAYLTGEGHDEVLEAFFQERLQRQREEARARIEGLEGRERLDEVAAVLTEEGFMAEVLENEDGEPGLRLCHCPLKEMVAVSRLPCRAEVAWIREMLGRELTRRSWMPEGDRTCTYTVG
jgi:predicted ArsR family transcriptional regulator